MRVSIITPERVAQETQAEAVFVPAWDGEMGILQNHLPVLAQLKPGEVRIQSEAGTDSFAISGGFIEVRNNHISIFAETAEAAQEIDVERARQAAEKAKQQLQAQGKGVNLLQAEAELRRALVRLHVAEAAHRKKRY